MKCELCGKIFPDELSDFEIFLHFVEKHKKQLEEISKNIGVGIEKNKSKLEKMKGKVNKSVNGNVCSDELKENKTKH